MSFFGDSNPSKYDDDVDDVDDDDVFRPFFLLRMTKLRWAGCNERNQYNPTVVAVSFVADSCLSVAHPPSPLAIFLLYRTGMAPSYMWWSFIDNSILVRFGGEREENGHFF